MAEHPTPPDSEEPDTEADAVELRHAVVDAAHHAQRLDKLLVALAPEFSRSHLQALVEAGHVQVGGQPARASSQKLRVGQPVRLALQPTAASQAFKPEAMALPIVHEDAHLLVLDKPAGLVVHPAAGHWAGTLLNGLLAHHAGAAALPRAGIVHRLDKDTTGLMVVAKTLPAMTELSRAIAAREVHRAYLALAHGQPRWEQQALDGAIARDGRNRLRMAVSASGKPARTDVQVLGRATGPPLATALRCTLHTGRTHQIRVHLAQAGHPLLGDSLYGGKPALGLARQALHATQLGLVHPATGQPVAWHSPLPADLAAAWLALGLARPAVG